MSDEEKKDLKRTGALVEDTSLSGLESGGVAPKDPEGKSTVEGATDEREEREDEA
jgi:hypothetical protein